jgi:hypothetical protein
MDNTCKHCNTIISKNKKYCNQECYNKDYYILIKCVGCGNEFETIKSNLNKRKYCNIKCSNSHIDRKQTKEKAKQTLQSKFGTSNPFEVHGYESFQSKEKSHKTSKAIKNAWNKKSQEEKSKIKEKIKHSLLGKTEKEKQSIIDKRKKTNNLLYGADFSTSKNSTLREKIDYNSRKSFINKLHEWLKEKNLELLDDYKGVKDDNGGIIYYKFKYIPKNVEFIDHLACGRLPIYHDPSLTNRISLAEQEISTFIKENYKGELLTNNRNLIKGLEIDVYLPELKLAIEFDGLKWHSESSGKMRNYHLNKTLECEKKDIHLIHIFEDEWRKQKDIVKSKILNLLNKTPNKIYARKCEIREVLNSESDKFLDDNHIQGKAKSKIKLGLYYENKIVSIITLGNYRKITGLNSIHNEYELIRYCSLLNTNVIGGFSKLLKFFIKKYSPSKIMSYADRRYSKGILYEKNGFKFIKNTPPNYWYMKYHNHREHRFKYRKSELPKLLENFDSNKSEWENMKLNGYDRIWDCGSKKYELIM